jgi:phenylacetate-coenzyme A ligase PaaK-like adenylate-forming protein
MKTHHFFFKIYANFLKSKIKKNKTQAIENQQIVLDFLIKKGRKTAFGKTHFFDKIKNYEDFKSQVPLRKYVDFEPWINRIFDGEKDVLWQGKPSFFAKTSGTTGGSKYIPITKDYLLSRNHSSKILACNVVLEKPNMTFLGEKIMIFSENHLFELKNGFRCAAISAIDSYHLPRWFDWLYLPGRAINQEPTYQKKIQRTIEKSSAYDVRMMFGLPVWLMLFLDEFERQKGQKFKDFFPNFELLMVSGMNSEPYETKLKSHLGEKINIIQAYVASEGYFAFQDQLDEKSMLLLTNQSIFYEFVPLDELEKENPKRFQLSEIELNKDYALVISTNAGLWAYVIGDIVRFVSERPYRLLVTGRLNQILSPFGEHLLPIEVENAITEAAKSSNAIVTHFAVVPNISPEKGLPHHEWYVEFEQKPSDENLFIEKIQTSLCQQNMCYSDLVKENAIAAPKIISVKSHFFSDWAISEKGNLAAQQKIAILQTDRQKFLDRIDI